LGAESYSLADLLVSVFYSLEDSLVLASYFLVDLLDVVFLAPSIQLVVVFCSLVDS